MPRQAACLFSMKWTQPTPPTTAGECYVGNMSGIRRSFMGGMLQEPLREVRGLRGPGVGMVVLRVPGQSWSRHVFPLHRLALYASAGELGVGV